MVAPAQEPAICNNYRTTIATWALQEGFAAAGLPLRFPNGAPNLAPREDVRITEPAPIVRRSGEGDAELVSLRWSWPAPNGKPVYNFRSEGRRFASGRCLVPADAFYEFTDPPGAPKRARKLKWTFTLADEPWFCIAGLWRPSDDGEAFTLLTVDPGPDVAPYHDRQIAVLRRDRWAAWLDGPEPEAELRPSPAGSFRIEPAPSAPG